MDIFNVLRKSPSPLIDTDKFGKTVQATARSISTTKKESPLEALLNFAGGSTGTIYYTGGSIAGQKLKDLISSPEEDDFSVYCDYLGNPLIMAIDKKDEIDEVCDCAAVTNLAKAAQTFFSTENKPIFQLNEDRLGRYFVYKGLGQTEGYCGLLLKESSEVSDSDSVVYNLLLNGPKYIPALKGFNDVLCPNRITEEEMMSKEREQQMRQEKSAQRTDNIRRRLQTLNAFK